MKKLFNCIDNKDMRLRNALFRAGSEKGYSALMTLVGTLREETVSELSKSGNSKGRIDCDALIQLTTQLSLCDQLLELNSKVKKTEDKNPSDYD